MPQPPNEMLIQFTIEDYESLYPLLVRLARKEAAQTRKNIERELAGWKAKCAKMSQRIGRFRQVTRKLREEARLNEASLYAVRTALNAKGTSIGDLLADYVKTPPKEEQVQS